MAAHPAALPWAPDVFPAPFDAIFVVPVSLLTFGTAGRFHHSALSGRYKGTGSRGRCFSVRQEGLTQILMCSSLTSAQQGFVLLVWITLFMRISLLVINACALHKSGFKFLFETRL